jgi:DNA-directed RNA polymerase subunit beta'
MVFGSLLYTKERLSTPELKILGEGITYLLQKIFALNSEKIELNARVKIRAKDFNEAGELAYKVIQTTATYCFNEVFLEAAGYINDVLTIKKT